MEVTKNKPIINHLKVHRLMTSNNKNHCNPVIAIPVQIIMSQVCVNVSSLLLNNSAQNEALHARVKNTLLNKVISSLDQ